VSRWDFRLSRGAATRAVIETKVDSALTSSDQAARYLALLPPGGMLVLVTRNPLVPGLAAQAGAQIGVELHGQNGVYRAETEGRVVLVLSWSRLLRAVVTDSGEPYPELVALSAAVEGLSDFVPFTDATHDTATGRTVTQLVDIAEEVGRHLPARLRQAEVRVDAVTGKAGHYRLGTYAKVTILAHQIWVGYSPRYWAVVPGDPAQRTSGKPGLPSPFWVNRFDEHVTPASAKAVVDVRRKRLDDLGVALALRLPLGAPIAEDD
jgi:hypothetical protein